jgi:WD40 repeat protein/serine/threonine protein kinase
MAIDTSQTLAQLILDNHLLDTGPTRELNDNLRDQFPDPKALARELIQRGWLSAYQVKQIFQGRAGELVLGPYIIEDRLGEGAMGQVFRARHRMLKRRVALKLVRKERLANPEAVQRFYREVQAAAQLSHPNIVLAYDADHVRETYFFAMEYVDGVDLARLVKESGPLPIATACDYIRQAALGLQHAFERGMVHRDIKPSNLLVTRPNKKASDSDAQPVVKILDMGLVRVESPIPASGRHAGGLTQLEAILGTPDYIAPEQARDAHSADIRADLYSLGCTFYFLLTGRVPYPGNASVEKLLKHWLEVPQPASELRPDLPAEVDAILRRLMAKRPEDRFQTPAEVAAALTALGERPGEAAPPPTSEEAVALDLPTDLAEAETAVAPVAQVDTTTTTPTVRRRERQSEKRLWMILNIGGGALLFFLIVILGAVALSQLHFAPALSTTPDLSNYNIDAALDALRAAVDNPQPDPDAVRGKLLTFRTVNAGAPQALEALHLLGKLRSPLDRLSIKDIPPSERAAWQPPELVKILGDQRLRQAGAVWGVALNNNGALVASGGDDQVFYLRDAATGQTKYALRGQAQAISALAVSEDGTIGASADLAGTVILWNLDGGRERARIKDAHAGPIHALAFSRDGKMLATGGDDRAVRLWQTADEKKKLDLPGHAGPIQCVAFSSDGEKLACACAGSVARLWDTAKGTALAALPESAGQANAVTFSPDGASLAFAVPGAGDKGPSVKLWDLAGNKERVALPGATGPLAWTPDGKTLLTVAGGAVLLWDVTVATPANPKTLPAAPRGQILALALSGDGRTFAVGDNQGEVHVWDAVTGKEQAGATERWTTGEYVAISPTHNQLVASAADSAGKAWDTQTGREQVFGAGAPLAVIHAAAFAPDGQTMVTGDQDGVVRLWDVSNTRDHRYLGRQSSAVLCAAFSPDGTLIATGCGDGMVFLWDAANPAAHPGRERSKFKAHTDPPAPVPVTAVAFSPDGKILATASKAKVVKLWNAFAVGSPKLLEGPTAGITSLAWSPDGKSLAAGGEDRTIRVWDAASPQQKSTFQLDSAPPIGLAYQPETGDLISAGQDGRVTFWKTGATKPTKEWQLPNGIQAMSLSVEGRYLALSANGSVYLFRLADAPK